MIKIDSFVMFCYLYLGAFHIFTWLFGTGDTNWNSFHVGTLYLSCLLLFLAIQDIRHKNDLR
jgi:hypothetical protein